MNKIIFRIIWMILALSSSAAMAGGKIYPLKDAPTSAEVVTVGFYPINVYDVDAASGTFSYDGYVWFRWNGKINPTDSVEFVNSVNKSDISRENIFPEPQKIPGGYNYQIMRIEGKFFNPFELSDFPLDSHDLSVKIEDSVHGVNELVYAMDKKDTGYGSGMAISGWHLRGWDHKQIVNDYGSTFGDTNAATQASRFAQMNFRIGIERPKSYFIWKLLLPLVIVLGGAWIALLLDPSLVEARAALPATALLTTVFLQQSYTSTLPESGSLVLLDKIYVVAYVLIVLTLAQVIINSRNLDGAPESRIADVRRLDVYSLVGQAAVFVVATAGLVILR